MCCYWPWLVLQRGGAAAPALVRGRRRPAPSDLRRARRARRDRGGRPSDTPAWRAPCVGGRGADPDLLRADALPSLLDLPCVLAPAMRLASGFAPREIYLQYDLLPSLLAIGWSKLGGTPLGFTLVVGAGYYALLVGLFLLARRLFTHGELAAPLLVALVVVRIYGVMIDANATPQASPIRLDLWPILVATTLALGLGTGRSARCWARCSSSRAAWERSISDHIALALGADLLAQPLRACQAAVRPRWPQDSGRDGARADAPSRRDRGRHCRRRGGLPRLRLGRRAPLPPDRGRHVAHRARVVLLVAVANDRGLRLAGLPAAGRGARPAVAGARSSWSRCWSRTRSTSSAAVTSTT